MTGFLHVTLSALMHKLITQIFLKGDVNNSQYFKLRSLKGPVAVSKHGFSYYVYVYLFSEQCVANNSLTLVFYLHLFELTS